MKHDLVLIHGWAVNSTIWQPILSRLEDDFQVTVVDLPGYGGNDREAEGRSLDSLVDYVFSVAPKRAVWVGWSLGGTIALQAALSDPQRISKLQLIATTPRFLNGDGWNCGQRHELFDALAEQFEQNFEKALKKFLLLQFGNGASPGSRSLVRETGKRLLTRVPPTLKTLNSGLAILRDTDLRDQVAQIEIETQVIGGSFDQVVPSTASQWLADELPNASYRLLSAGHVPFLELPDEYTASLESLAGGAGA